MTHAYDGLGASGPAPGTPGSARDRPWVGLWIRSMLGTPPNRW